jgi:hypothetical protein
MDQKLLADYPALFNNVISARKTTLVRGTRSYHGSFEQSLIALDFKELFNDRCGAIPN